MPTATESPATTFELIGPLQARVMDVLWKLGRSGTVHEVHQALNAERGAKHLAYTTILTVMRNLARRGLCSQERTGTRSHGFRPLVSREDYERAYVRHSIGTVFCGSHARLRMALSFTEAN